MVAHHDRLCRFAYNLLEHVFILNGIKVIVVHTEDDTSNSAAQELSEDILAINTVFICRMQGRRAAENRRRRRDQQRQQGREEDQGESGVCEEEGQHVGFDKGDED